MAASSRVVFVLGAGPNVGSKVAERFTSAGYKVAVASRSGKTVPSSTAALSIATDLTDPEKVNSTFEEVRKKLGEPSVVVYNGNYENLPTQNPDTCEFTSY
jgi:NAD(P)-dependent dehydrogenase (short-subunit alcohol dehydrogenase family)